MKQPPPTPPISGEQAFELPRRIQGNQELLDLFTRNNSLLIRFVCSDNVHQPDLEVLAQMKMNQMKVDSIAQHQNQMVDYLLSRGVERFNGNGHAAAPAVESAVSPLALPEPPARKTKSAPGARSEVLIEYARAHGGELRLSQFRADYMSKDPKFATTGVYPVAHTLLKAGTIKRVGEGVYRLVDGEPPKRGRPRKQQGPRQGQEPQQEGYQPEPSDTPFGRGKVAMLDWAHAHNGEIVLMDFWPEYERAGGNPSFRKAMYVAGENFVRAGVFKKLGSGYYRLLNTPEPPDQAPTDTPEEPETQLDMQPDEQHSQPDEPAAAAPQTTELPPWTGSGGKEVIVYWAGHHDGIFAVRDFRPWWMASNTGSATFAKTTVFTTLHQLAEDGLAKKTGPGEYKIYVAKARKALGLE